MQNGGRQSFPMPEGLWTRECISYVQGRMDAHHVSYEALAEALTERGTAIDAATLHARIGRGEISAGLFFQIMHLLGQPSVGIAEIDPSETE